MNTNNISFKKSILALSLLASISAFATSHATASPANTSSVVHIEQIEHGLDIESIRFDAETKNIYVKVNVLDPSDDFYLVINSGVDYRLGSVRNSDEISIPLSKFGELSPDRKFTIMYFNNLNNDDYQFKSLIDPSFLYYANNSAKVFNLQDIDSQSLEISGGGVPGQKISASIEYIYDKLIDPIHLGETIVGNDGTFDINLNKAVSGMKPITLTVKGELNSFKKTIITNRIDEHEELFSNNSFQVDNGLSGWFKRADRGDFNKMDGYGNFTGYTSIAQPIYFPLGSADYKFSMMVRVNKYMTNFDHGSIYVGNVSTDGTIGSEVKEFNFTENDLGIWKEINTNIPINIQEGRLQNLTIGFGNVFIEDMDVKDVSFSLSD